MKLKMRSNHSCEIVNPEFSASRLMKSERVMKEESLSPQRRSFLGALIGSIISGITIVLGVAIGRYSILPALRPTRKSQWATVGLLEEFPEGEPVKRYVVVSQDAGWGRFNSQQLVWVIKKGEQVTIFSAICPHLSCTINLAANGFVCPCHGSAWNRDGEKLGGPTPRGMDVLEHRVEGDLLKVKYQFFKQGVAKREEIG
jgi:succinate dehydrogenase / fumarate reductase iron-sulfur subunit